MIDAKVITAPDVEHSNMLKIMLVDFEWQDIEDFTDVLSRSPDPPAVYLYGQNDTDHVWCLSVARQSDAVLINTYQRGSIEMLKGYLLSLPQAAAYGKNNNAFMARQTYQDMSAWFTEVIKYYAIKTRGQDGI
jgi:hypothetical protein